MVADNEGLKQRMRTLIGWCVVSLAASQAAASPTLEGGTLTHVALLRRLAGEAVDEMLKEVVGHCQGPILVQPRAEHVGNRIVADVISDRLTHAGFVVRVTDSAAEAPPAPLAASPAVTADPADAAADSGAVSDGGTSEEDVAAGDTASAAPPATSTLQHILALENSMAAPGATPVSTPAVPPAPIAFDGQRLVFGVTEFGVRYVGEGRSFFLSAKRVERAAAVDLSCRLIEGKEGDIRAVGHGDALALDEISKGKLRLYESDGFTPKLETGSGAMRFAEPVVVGGILVGLIYLFYTNQN